MSNRTITIAACIGFALAVVVMLSLNASISRKMAPQQKVVLAGTTEEIARIWSSAGVKGRLAVLFSRRLNIVEPTPDSKQFQYIESLMHEGVIRNVYHVVPDSAWGDVRNNLSKRHDARPGASGYSVLFAEGRVNVMPLSQFHLKIREQVLIVIEAGLWSSDEKVKIRKLIDTQLTPDILTLYRAEPEDLAVLSAGALK